MFQRLSPAETARICSIVLVILVSAAIGRQAAFGMGVQQWVGAVAAIFGSIVLATLIHTAPEPERVKVRERD